MQSFMLKKIDIDILLGFLEESYAITFKRVKKTSSIIFGVFLHDPFLQRRPGELSLTIILDYEASENVATLWCIATGGVRMEDTALQAAERDFTLYVRKLAIDRNWEIEYGPEKMILTCPYCNARYTYLAEEVKGSFADSTRCKNCDKLFRPE
ncbi:MAG: hypothetical protein ACW975_08820 [Candidatus Thorarchaeota archaeon]|jgi:hypothetical protein